MPMNKDEQISILRDVVKQCEDQFSFYEKEHLKKFTEDGNRKAAVNKEYVELCKQALHDTHPDFSYSKWGRVLYVVAIAFLLAILFASTGGF